MADRFAPLRRSHRLPDTCPSQPKRGLKTLRFQPNGFCVFLSRDALARLVRHDWPGNARELKAFATNAVVSVLSAQLETGRSGRAPAVLPVPDPLVDRLLLPAPASNPAAEARAAASEVIRGAFATRVRVVAQDTLKQVATEVERQYLTAMFRHVDGDLTRMARALLGERGTSRQVHLRLNQLGLRVRRLRGMP